MNIYQRINEVRKNIEYLQKLKSVESYKAVTHDQVTAATRTLLVQHGVVIVPELVSQSVQLTGTQTSRGTPFIRWEGSYRFHVVNVDEPSDKFSAEIAAHAIDQGDKAPGKALSYAKKALILKLLEIETGEDDEGREEQFKPKGESKSVASETWDKMTRAQQAKLAEISVVIIDHLRDGEDQKAFEYYEEQKSKLDADEQVALWKRLDSKQRNTIKTLGEAWRKRDAALKKAI
jgi:hypothetical protein